MSLAFEDKGLKVQNYSDNDHPLVLFLKGDAETREDILLSHPDVIGFICLHEGQVTKTFLPKKVINFKATSPENKKVSLWMIPVKFSQKKVSSWMIPVMFITK